VQASALRILAEPGAEPGDVWDDYDGSERHLSWYRHQRTIESLRRRGWADDNGITDAGREALDSVTPRWLHVVQVVGPQEGLRGVLVKRGDPIGGVVVASDVFLFEGRPWGDALGGWRCAWVREERLAPYSGPLTREEVRWIEAKQGGWPSRGSA
jgi:hypothetical protein